MPKQLVDTRWVLTWEMAEGKKCVKARIAAKGFQDPDLKDGLAETSGCVSLRSSRLQVISPSAIRNGKLWGLDIKNAFLQADGFERDVFCVRHRNGTHPVRRGCGNLRRRRMG